ncbi:MAG TPA: hypothetical protein VLB29_09830 [Nocardioidaceae bacterium]|nr:hypothetical protein [Nocardioidaceae bacterium]
MKYRREWKLDDPTNIITCAVAMLFLGAGIIHLSAAADHANLPVMMAGFTVVALAQMGVAALLFLQGPSRGLVVLGLVLMVGSLTVWLVSRTVGLPVLPGGHMEPIGFKDGVTVLFELAAVPGLLALSSPWIREVSLPTPHLGRQALTGLAAGIALMFVPALLLGGGGHHSADQLAALSGAAHDHADGDHAHGEESSAAAEEGHHDTAAHDGGSHEGGSHEHSEGAGQTLSSQGHHGQGFGPDPLHSQHASSNAAHGQAHAASGHEAHSGDDHEARGSSGSAMSASDDRSHGDHGDGTSGHGEHDGSGHGGGAGEGDGHADHETGGHEGDDSEHGGDHGGEGGHESGGHDGGEHGDGGHEGGGHGGADRGPAPVPGVATRRAQYIEPKPAGTKETITLQYGPHPVTPGGDANQVNFDFFGADGFIVSAKPSIRYADGTAVGHDGVHLHHAHLIRKDLEEDDTADTRQGIDWVFGTGGEQTQGSFERISAAEPGDDQWGIRLRPEELLMYWMPMNMTEQTQAVFMEFEFTFVHGTPQEIKKSTGQTYRPVEPVIYGSTFDVPKTGDIYDWPLDAKPSEADAISESKADPDSFGTAEPREKSNVEVGVGEIWTAPRDGVLIGGAGHQHGGAKGVVLSNLGSKAQPCAEDGDRFPGTTVFNSKTYYPHGVWPAHPLMGISQPGWRVPVKKGDRIAMNGVFDARKYAFPDQMSITGFYWDKNTTVSEDQRCRAWLADEPDATPAEAADSLPSQTAERGDDGSAWVHASPQPCVAEECNDHSAPQEPRGPHTNVITAENFMFTPGDLKRQSSIGGTMGDSGGGAPVVEWGEKLRFVNLDFAEKGGTRHVITSCIGPCNGPTDVLSYPNTNGKFYSGPLGYLPLADGASANNKAVPTWELDTSKLKPGYHTYYCWNHPWMRGAFYVEDMSQVQDDSPARSTTEPLRTPEPPSMTERLREAEGKESPSVLTPLGDVSGSEGQWLPGS